MRLSIKAKTHNFLQNLQTETFRTYLHSHATKIPYIFTQSGSVLFHQLFQINV